MIGQDVPQLDPDFARIESQSAGQQSNIQNLPKPPSAFVASLNGLNGDVNLQGGTSGGVTINISLGTGTLTLSVTGIDPIATKKSKLNATVAPSATDDAAHGYAVGSTWIDVTLGDVYMCVDATATAAVWRKLN